MVAESTPSEQPKEPPTKKVKVAGVEIHYQESAGMSPWSILKGLTDDDMAELVFYRSKGRIVIGNVVVRTCPREAS